MSICGSIVKIFSDVRVLMENNYQIKFIICESKSNNSIEVKMILSNYDVAKKICDELNKGKYTMKDFERVFYTIWRLT